MNTSVYEAILYKEQSADTVFFKFVNKHIPINTPMHEQTQSTACNKLMVKQYEW